MPTSVYLYATKQIVSLPDAQTQNLVAGGHASFAAVTPPALTSQMRTLRTAALTTVCRAALSALSSTPQTLATVAAGYGVNIEDAEKHLGLLVDEGLATRSAGSRTTARYTAT